MGLYQKPEIVVIAGAKSEAIHWFTDIMDCFTPFAMTKNRLLKQPLRILHSGWFSRFQAKAFRLYIQAHAVRLYIRALVEVRRIVFHSASKKELTKKTTIPKTASIFEIAAYGFDIVNL
ncbi:MAG: hypothetical protein LBF89_09660 [Bacteroidales bacterium]|nr:hypothetical protein [Bacteroidales bacterium]